MRRSSGRWPLCRSALVLAAVLGLGCVTRGTYQEAVTERDALRAERERLEERVSRLEASSQSLDAERVALIDELEDLHQAQTKLDADVRRLRKAEAELSRNLAEREAQLASRSEELERLQGTYEGLVHDLEAEVAAGQIEIEQLRDGLHLNMAQEVLFASGSAQVNARGQGVLAKVAERVRGLPHGIEVRGHTDNVPIHSKRYPTNWELAGARASGVVRLLVKRGVDPRRLSAVSLGEFAPRASNDTAKGRSRNRRIEITLKPTPEASAAGRKAARQQETAAGGGAEGPPASSP